MKITFMTSNGKRSIEADIERKEERIKEIQKEKEIAYQVSGDGWHDNPGFNNLTLLEEREMGELVALKNRVANAKIWDAEKRNIERAEIGSIVKIRVENQTKKRIHEMTFEIVGNGESDLSKNLIAYDTPIGKAVLNLKKGEVTETNIPAGKIKIELLGLFSHWVDIQK